jgi:DNA-(apurinic or apyrimidinic site) lyase
MNQPRIHQFGTILQKIPLGTWEDIVLLDPECQHIGPFRYHYHFGGFASLMVMLALNSYQLKGKAELNYWYAMHQHLSCFSRPRTREELTKILIPFYEKERLPTGKLKRVHRFFSSDFAQNLWNSNPDQIINDFSYYWTWLSKIMNQKKNAKTICFAMKCLGISVLLSGNYRVDFSSIPIPVDSRITSFTEMMNFTTECSQKNIQCIWNQVLELIQETNPKISMIHLDSLIWQIGTLNEHDLNSYFYNKQLPEIAEELNDFKHRNFR